MLPLPHMAFARITQNHGTQEFAAARAPASPSLQANPLPFSYAQATIVLPDLSGSKPLSGAEKTVTFTIVSNNSKGPIAGPFAFRSVI